MTMGKDIKELLEVCSSKRRNLFRCSVECRLEVHVLCAGFGGASGSVSAGCGSLRQDGANHIYCHIDMLLHLCAVNYHRCTISGAHSQNQ